MTDEQMLAKYGYDKEPWVARPYRLNSGNEWSAEERHGIQGDPMFGSTFNPRPECIPSRFDHRFMAEPFARVADDWRCAFCGVHREDHGRPEVNPILSAFRRDADIFAAEFRKQHLLVYLDSFDVINGLSDATPEQVSFARKVLTRLAAL